MGKRCFVAVDDGTAVYSLASFRLAKEEGNGRLFIFFDQNDYLLDVLGCRKKDNVLATLVGFAA
jgi:hypothetical protein